MICDCVETSSETVAQCDKRDVYNFFSRQAECRHMRVEILLGFFPGK